jgi:hypothetical protein
MRLVEMVHWYYYSIARHSACLILVSPLIKMSTSLEPRFWPSPTRRRCQACHNIICPLLRNGALLTVLYPDIARRSHQVPPSCLFIDAKGRGRGSKIANGLSRACRHQTEVGLWTSKKSRSPYCSYSPLPTGSSAPGARAIRIGSIAQLPGTQS